ncbi:hypothetical protein ACJRO7_027360 [Eucalyptus globulus]|uniref:TIR domain-containing protein n=1 Tax=Eucalyptus globulus TaxID=34317 RepID=A0ABD3JR23_EUCGL
MVLSVLGNLRSGVDVIVGKAVSTDEQENEKQGDGYARSVQSPQLPVVSSNRTTTMAAHGTESAIGISETFAKLKKMGKVEATPSLSRGSHFNATLNEVAPQSMAILSNYNLILKFGVERFMSTMNDAGVHGQRPPRVYDVFISYKQEDMLHTMSHLKSTLERREMKTFVDFTLDGGVPFRPAINEAVERSKSAVVVVSQNYHLSPWCLNELVKILECQKRWGLVLPIFWEMNARDLREQPRHFVENIGQGEKGFKQDKPHQVQKWRDALRTLGMIKGWSPSTRY